MKNFKFFLIIAIAILIASCSKRNKAVDEYCNCMYKIATDSLLSGDVISETHKKCFDSVVNKFKLNEDKEFIATFDSIDKVKNVKRVVYSKVCDNIDKLLKSHNFEKMDIWNNEYVRFEFDGKMVTLTQFKMRSLFTGWSVNQKRTGTYKIENQNGKFYLTLDIESNKGIFEFMQGNKADYNYLLKEKLIKKNDYPVYLIKGETTCYSRKNNT